MSKIEERTCDNCGCTSEVKVLTSNTGDILSNNVKKEYWNCPICRKKNEKVLRIRWGI